MKPADLLLCPVERFSRTFRTQLLVLTAVIFCPHRGSLGKYKGWPRCSLSSSRVKNTNKNKRLRRTDTEADTRSHVYVMHKTDYPHAALKSSRANKCVSHYFHPWFFSYGVSSASRSWIQQSDCSHSASRLRNCSSVRSGHSLCSETERKTTCVSVICCFSQQD